MRPLTRNRFVEQIMPIIQNGVVQNVKELMSNQAAMKLFESFPSGANLPDFAGAASSIPSPQQVPGLSNVTNAAAGAYGSMGMANPANVTNYVSDFHQLQGNWSNLTPDARLQELGRIANTQLSAVGVPGVTAIRDTALAPGNANFHPEAWQMHLPAQTIDSPTLSNADAQTLADNVYHESRHAEQFYRIAQDQVQNTGSALTPAFMDRMTVANNLNIPSDVVLQAQRNPLPAGSDIAPYAQTMYNSIYGTGAAARSTVLNNLPVFGNAANAAQTSFNSLQQQVASGGVTPQQLQTAGQSLQQAIQARDQNYLAYRTLPEEADAWNVGNAVRGAW